MASLPSPVKVSPLIKLTRWSLLITGIFYGISKKQYYKEVEKEYQKERAKRKIVEDALLAERKKKIAEAERQALELLSKPIL